MHTCHNMHPSEPRKEFRTSPKLPSRRCRYSWDTVPDNDGTMHPNARAKSCWQERMTIPAVCSAQERSDYDLYRDIDLPPGIVERSGWGIVDCYGYGVRFFTPTSPGTRCNPIQWHDRAMETGTVRASRRPFSAAGAAVWRGSDACSGSRPRRSSALSQPPPATTRLAIELGTWRTPLRPCMLSPPRYLSASSH